MRGLTVRVLPINPRSLCYSFFPPCIHCICLYKQVFCACHFFSVYFNIRHSLLPSFITLHPSSISSLISFTSPLSSLTLLYLTLHQLPCLLLARFNFRWEFLCTVSRQPIPPYVKNQQCSSSGLIFLFPCPLSCHLLCSFLYSLSFFFLFLSPGSAFLCFCVVGQDCFYSL